MPPERLQQHPLFFTTNHTDRTFFVWRLNSARPLHPGHSTILLLSEIPSGMSAKLRTVAASNNKDQPARSLSSSLLARTINGSPDSQALLEVTHQVHSIGITLLLLVLATYISGFSSSTSRSWWITQSTQRHRRGCNTGLHAMPTDILYVNLTMTEPSRQFYVQWYHFWKQCNVNECSTCCNLSSGVALMVWFTTNGMNVKNKTIYAWREQAIIREIATHNFYCCLLPRCEGLRTCRSGFPIATTSIPFSFETLTLSKLNFQHSQA